MTQIVLPSGLSVDFGDAPQEEVEDALEAMREQDPSLFEEAQTEPQNIDDLLARSGYSEKGQSVEEAPAFKPTHEGEVKDLSLQYYVGRGDTDEERLLRLTEVFGQEGVTQVGVDDFVLNLDNITEDVKEKFNLPESGTIRFNQPGLGWQDVAGFLGRETVPLVAAVGASIAATGMGAPAGIALVGAAGAAGKAIDEFIFEDIFEGLQRQDTGEVLKDVAIQALIEGGGEGLGRGVMWGAKRLLKGKGPLPDSVRVAELREKYIADGASPDKATRMATKAAREETSSMYRQMIEDGANIPAVTLSGKNILGRTQAIWESIFPNEAAVARNVDYVNKVLQRHQMGEISSDQAKELITQTAESMAAKLAQSMADPDQIVKQANKELRTVLEKEFDTINKVLENTTAGSQGLATEFQRGLELATKLFTFRSGQMYRQADELLTGEMINLKPLQDRLGELQKNVLKGGEQLQGGIFKHIMETPNLSISEIPALRAALRATEAHPDLLGTVAGRNIKELLDIVNGSIKKKEIELAQQIGKSVEGEGFVMGLPDDVLATKRKGLDLLAGANKHYEEGAEIINSGMIQQMNQLIKDKNIVDLKGLVDLAVRPNQPNLLKFVLDTVTPESAEINAIIEVGKARPGFFAELQERILGGDIKGVNQALEEAGLGAASLEKAGIKAEKHMFTVPEIYNQLPKNDPTRMRLQNDFSEMLKLYDEMATAARRPGDFREGFRSLLAKNWMDDAVKLNQSDEGINYKALVSSFDSLGTKVQNELFGQQAGEFRRVMNDFKLLSRTSAKQLDEFMGNIGNQDARSIVDAFKGVVRQAEAEGQDAFTRTMRGGPVDVDKLVINVLKNPKNYDTLRARVGDDMLDAPGGFKDLVMERIVASGFPTGNVTDDVVQSGAFGQSWLKTMKDMNKAGALNKILGDEAVSDLMRIAKAGEAVSDSVMKGKTGLAAAGYAAGFGTALIMNPIATLGGAASIMALSRALRSKPIMKYLASPRLRAYEAERAMKMGADIGPRNIAAEKARESALRSLRTILVDAGYYAGGRGADTVTREVEAQMGPNQEEVVSETVTQQAPAPRPQPQMPAQQAQAPVPQIPAAVAQPSPLLQAEINKLYGMPPV
jgi:hypothetical protein